MATYSYPEDFIGTSWTVNDGDIYVSAIGNDNTADGSPIKPYFSLQVAVANASSGNKIVIGTGNYNENLDGLGKNCYYQADGTVVMDGNEIGGTALSNLGTDSKVERFTIQNYDIALEGGMDELSKCYINACNIEDFQGVISYSIFETVIIGATSDTFLHNCSFINAQTETDSSKIIFVEVRDCHFDSLSVFYFLTSSLSSFDYCNQKAGSVINIDGTNFSTASSINAALSSFQAHGLSVDPQFNDTTIKDYSLKGTSPLLAKGSTGRQIGALGLAFLKRPDALVGATLMNVMVNAANKYELNPSAAWGTIETKEIDLGSANVLGMLSLIAESDIGMPPFNAIVKNIAYALNLQPDMLSFEMRYSTIKGIAATLPYKSFIWNLQPTIDFLGRSNASSGFDNATAKQISVRYIQIKITLRSFINLQSEYSLLLENSSRLLLED